MNMDVSIKELIGDKHLISTRVPEEGLQLFPTITLGTKGYM
jgi:hypothetical protein